MRLFIILFTLSFIINLVSCTGDPDGTGTTEYVYQDSGLYGLNILDLNKEAYVGVDFSLATTIPENGDLYVKITKLSGAVWKVSIGTVKNWVASNYNYTTKSQVFTVMSADVASDCKLEIPQGTFQIDYYEGDAISPTRSRVVKVN